jgi:hypothetical protein
MRSRVRVAALVVGAGVVVVVAVTWPVVPALELLIGGLREPNHSSDGELIANFHRHRLEFERLREMIAQDVALIEVTADSTLPPDPQAVGVSSSRIADYRKLLDRLNISDGLDAATDRKTIRLTSSNQGFAGHNSRKGYVYTNEVGKQEVFPDLDRFSAKQVGGGIRHIEGNWYLFFTGY